MFQLSSEYEDVYNEMLKQVGSTHRLALNPLSLFWPMRGHRFDGNLMVIGRSPNGWDVNASKQELARTEECSRLIKETRSLSECANRCPMNWLTDLERYDWTESRFFVFMNCILLLNDRERSEDWASWVCYSNLYKIGLKAKNTPLPEPLKRVQFACNVKLLQQEIEEFNPGNVLVMTGQKWFRPFADKLGLKMEWHEDIAEGGKSPVEGVAKQGQRHWVVARHPMILPANCTEDMFVSQITKAFAGKFKK